MNAVLRSGCSRLYPIGAVKLSTPVKSRSVSSTTLSCTGLSSAAAWNAQKSPMLPITMSSSCPCPLATSTTAAATSTAARKPLNICFLSVDM